MRCLKMLRVLFKCWADEVSVGEKNNDFPCAPLAPRKECSNSVSISPSVPVPSHWTDGRAKSEQPTPVSNIN
jgi:hypothetical protein